jgi:hypothetical protein
VHSLSVRTLEYFYIRVEHQPGRAYELLQTLAAEEVNLLAFSAVPYGANRVELTIFPDHSERLLRAATKHGWALSSAQHACLIQGDDQLGALAEIQKKLIDAGVSIYASSGITDGEGHFGYVIYFKEGDHILAQRALEV